MITTYSELLPMVLPELRNCPEPLALQALERAGRDLCLRTCLWQKELSAMDVVADQSTYDLAPGETVPEDDPQPEIRFIDWVKISGGYITSTHYKLSRSTADDTDFALEFLTGYVPAAAVTDGLTLNVVLTPNRASGYLSSFILDAYGDTLVAGALFYLLGMARKPWADPQRSADKYHEWGVGNARAMEESYLGRQTGSLSINLTAALRGL